jgi:hypothetical protein
MISVLCAIRVILSIYPLALKLLTSKFASHIYNFGSNFIKFCQKIIFFYKYINKMWKAYLRLDLKRA